MMPDSIQSGSRGFDRPDGVALKEHLETRLDALQRHIEAQLQSIDRATCLALQAMDKRLEVMNEFRGSLNDTTSRLVSREELAALNVRYLDSVARLDADISELKTYRATMEGKASQSSVNTATVLSVLGLVMAIVSLALKLL
jgi:hypothetical protein